MEDTEIISRGKRDSEAPKKSGKRVGNLDETQVVSQGGKSEQHENLNDTAIMGLDDQEESKNEGISVENEEKSAVAVIEPTAKSPSKTVTPTERRYISGAGKIATRAVRRQVNHLAIKKVAEKEDYKILEEVAKGAESVLYAATVDGHKVCVKAIRNWKNKIFGSAPTRNQKEKLTDVAYRTKLRHIQNEYKVSQKLFSEKEMPVVHIYALRRVTFWGMELGYDLIMELFNGNDLGEKEVQKKLTRDEKIRVVYQSVKALDFFHKHGYIHLDIKPSNFIMHNGTVKLLDFGVSVQSGYVPKAITGTGGYLSPEQICKETLDEKTDIYALGLTFAVLFGGKALQQPQNELLSKQFRLDAKYHLDHDEMSVITELPELADVPEFAQIIKDCSIPRRDKRPASCQALLAKMKAWAAEIGFNLEVEAIMR